MNRTSKLATLFACLAAVAAPMAAPAGSASLYVQDGLVACWDGIENAGANTHNPSATVWKDLVGGYEFTLTGVTVEDDRMIFAGSTSSYGTLSATDTTSTFVAAKNGTMEIVYVCRSTSLQVLLQSTAESGLAFGLYNASSIITHSASSEDRKPLISFTSGTTTNSVSVRFTSGGPVSAIANGESKTLSGSNYWGSPDASMTFIGKRASNAAAFSGSFYCIRLYNRQLTDAEIAANHALDVKRFREGNHFGDSLDISGAPNGIGSPSPAYGSLSGLSAGATVSVSCGNVPAIGTDGKAYACTGWKLYDENGDVVSNGTETAFTYVHPTPAESRRLEWQWAESLTLLPIPDQVNETFDPCRPELTVSNIVNGTTWTIGGNLSSPYFDVEYTNHFGAGTATATVTGKGDLSGLILEQTFNISATKLEDNNISTTDTSARRLLVDGKSVYVFTDTSSAHTATAKRGINLTDYLVVGGGGGGGAGQGGGGGGGGGVTNAAGIADAYVAQGSTFTVVVGAGGTGSSGQSDKGFNGGMSSLQFGMIDVGAPGGGGGGSWNVTAGAAGASGGGGCQNGAGGVGIDGFGFAGATGLGSNSAGSGGGGGAGHAGYQGNTSSRIAGNGGEGVSNIITGAWAWYGGGGGGGGAHQSLWWKYDVGLGGLGGGGNGGKDAVGCDGVDGLGGGGGGGGAGYGGATTPISMPGGKGGSGTVILAIKAADFEVDAIPDQYLTTGGCEPLPVVRDGTTVLVKDTDYTVAYANNTQTGAATLTITGIGTYDGKSATIGFKIVSRYFAKPSVSAGGDGRSWATAMSVAGAFAAAEAETGFREIWIQSRTVSQPAISIANSGALTIRGGFAGTESTLDQRQPGALTVFDGENTANILLAIDNATDDDVVLDRIKFCRAKSNGLVKTGKGGLRAYECAFEANGSGAARAYGHGLNAQSDGYGSLVVSDCVFAGNKNVSGDTQYGGFGLYVNKFNDALVENSLFVTNGYNIAKAENAYCGMYTKGSAIFVVDTPITVRGSRFAGNCCPIRKSLGGADGSGGVIALTGASGGSRFENCAFVGNTECRSAGMNYTTDGSGALAVYLNSASAKVAVNNCTFAYNLTQADHSAGGITVLKGSVDIANSIFWKNARYPYAKPGYATDVHAQASGSVTIRDSIVTSLDGSALIGANLVVDEDSVFAVDPRLVTSTADYENLLVVTDSAMYYDYSRASRYEDLAAMDAHLLSPAGYVVNGGAVGPATASTSPALDAGDPEADYANEPLPNGGRLNLGAYGNTAEASRTAIGQPEATVAVLFPGGEARPAAQVTMGLESENGYLASVHVVCSTGGVTLAEETFHQVANGDILELRSPSYLPPGTVFDVTATIVSLDTESRTYTVSQAVSGTYPSFYGKGGGPSVIHVRTGADGLKDGSNWEHAYPDLRAAFASAPDASKTEVWLSVTNDYLDAAMTLDHSLTFRGGFTGAENSPDERPEGLLSTLDGQKYYKTMQIAVPSEMLLTVERIHVLHAVDSGIKKTGAGDFTVRDCVFADSRSDNGTLQGGGIYASGGTVSITNCQFVNLIGANATSYATHGGDGIYLTSCTQAYVDDCLFATNGVVFNRNKVAQARHTGAAAYINATPTVFRNCRFASNAAAIQETADSAGTIHFKGASGGSKLINCALVGNSDFEGAQSSADPVAGGTIVCNMSTADATLDIENCTIAYNLTQGKWTGAGINVCKGTVNVKNSIVFGNVRNRNSDTVNAGADIEVKSTGTLNMTYSLVTGLTSNCVNVVEGGTLDIGDGVICGDPLLVTTTNDFQSLFADYNGLPYLPQSARGACAAIDVHLRSYIGYLADGQLVKFLWDLSPAIDKGDRRSDYSREPVIPGVGGNGHRVNLGAYGNTPEAALSPFMGTVLIVR